MQSKKTILLFGSGLMAESLANKLLQRQQNCLIVASDLEEQAKLLVDKLGKDRCSAAKVNVADPASTGPLIQKSDIVISYVPAFLHIHVARVCLQKGKNLLTASYVSPEMKALDEEVKAKGLIFLNQLGLDPGIDHLTTMKTVDQVHKEGGRILQYQSWCGGLPSPTDCDNPLGYKFTWSPIGAFRALSNKATYLDNNQDIEIEAKDLLYFGEKIILNQAVQLQGYPNRNSIPYKQLYGMKDASKVLRGTLRYKGFCTIINALKEIGVIYEKPVLADNWRDHVSKLLEGQEGQTLEKKIQNRCIKKVKHYEKLSEEQKIIRLKLIQNAFSFFGLLSHESQIHDPTKTSLQNLISQLEPVLNLRKGQTDLIAMQHLFVVEKQGKKFLRKSWMIQIGEKKGFSAMSLTVGNPTAIGAQLVLDNKISERGVIIPIYEDIYKPVLEQLEAEGIKLVESQQPLPI